jgi:type I restriction enzyme R subunit
MSGSYLTHYNRHFAFHDERRQAAHTGNTTHPESKPVSLNEEETRYHLIDPILRRKGYDDPLRIRLETPAPVEPVGPKGRRAKGGGRTDYLLCVQVGDMPKPLPVGVLEAKRENAEPMQGMGQAKNYADCKRFDVQYVFSTNGHLYCEYDKPSGKYSEPPFPPLSDFPPHPDLRARYARDKGIDITQPEAAMLFQADSPAWNKSRYYQDAAIRAAFEHILCARKEGRPPRVLLTLATGAGKTIIATNLLWRMSQAGMLPKPALFLCDRDELRTQAYEKLSAAFGNNVRVVENERGKNAAHNARIHIATYQTLGIDEDGDGSFLTDHYGEDAFSVIIIDECHRSAWGKWSQVLTRNPNAIQIGLTATPRKLKPPKHTKQSPAVAAALADDEAITAHNVKYFGEPVYEYTLVQAQEDGYLAACEIVKRKPSIDSEVFTRDEIVKAGVRDIKTGRPLTADDLKKDEYTGKDFDDELFIDLRTPKMCDDLFELLCENGGPEQKVIVFCTRDIQADRVQLRMNNLYAEWCKANGKERKEDYAFKCTSKGGADKIDIMRGSGERAFIACTVDLLEAGVDIERLNAVAFFRYLQSSIKFYQMVGRGTRIHEETQKYKFWLYDYTGVTDLFGTEFISSPPRSGGGGGGGSGGDDDDDGDDDGLPIPVMGVPSIVILKGGHHIMCNRDGRETPVPVDEYRREVLQRVLAEAHNLDDFRSLWIEVKKRRQLINHILGDNFSPEAIRNADKMEDFDLYDYFGKLSYHARALKRPERGREYVTTNEAWFAGMDAKAAIVLKGLGDQFAQGGTDALETRALWDVPVIAGAGGLKALSKLGEPARVMQEAKLRLFRV